MAMQPGQISPHPNSGAWTDLRNCTSNHHYQYKSNDVILPCTTPQNFLFRLHNYQAQCLTFFPGIPIFYSLISFRAMLNISSKKSIPCYYIFQPAFFFIVFFFFFITQHHILSICLQMFFHCSIRILDTGNGCVKTLWELNKYLLDEEIYELI